MAKDERTFVGLYCGPSVDGIDAALVNVRGRAEKMKVRQTHFLCRAVPRPLRKRLRKAAGGWAEAATDLAKLNRDVGASLVHACEAVLKAGRVASKYVAGVGLMGPAAAYVEPTLSEGPGAVMELDSAATVARVAS